MKRKLAAGLAALLMTGAAACADGNYGFTREVPNGYFETASHAGSVERLDYNSFDYANDGSEIIKTAYVYLPYGYEDSEEKYDILYLMHGWGGHAGEYFEYAGIKEMLDNMILRGDIKPIIAVSASFYTDSSPRDFSSSIQALRAFHEDFENCLMPAVELKYKTYAYNATDEALRASRDHRAFGGFSLGSVTTWLELCHDYEYIRYFLPMSGSCWYFGTYGDFQTKNNVDYIEKLFNDNDLSDRTFIYFTTGTLDSVKSQSLMQADEMLSRDVFTPKNFAFYQKDGGYHDHYAVREYMYNALSLFFASEEG